MAKKNKPAASASAPVEAPKTETTPTETPAPVTAPKVKRTKVQIPLTPAQEAARLALAQADEAAKAELIANSSGKITEKEAELATAEAQVRTLREELKTLKKAVGIKGVFGGGKKVTHLTFAQDFPEGKGAPQARQILEIVKAAGTAGVARKDVVKTMETVINTKMDRSRLLSYYCSRMIAEGVITGS